MQIYDDNTFRDLINKFNSLYSHLDEWEFTTARKEHDDEFGDKIVEGEVYFKRKYGAGGNDVLKLSRSSMEKMLYCIFNGNFQLEKLCKKLLE